jgi:hypothetical protein
MADCSRVRTFCSNAHRQTSMPHASSSSCIRSVAESSHAKLWREKLAVAGVQDEHFVPGFPTRLLARLARRFGPGFVRPSLAAAKFSDRNKYAGQSDAHTGHIGRRRGPRNEAFVHVADQKSFTRAARILYRGSISRDPISRAAGPLGVLRERFRREEHRARYI